MAEDQVFYVGQKAFLEKDGNVLVLHDYLGLDFPGGKIQDGELDLIKSLKREVKEETGLEIEIGNVFTTWINKFPDGHKYAGKKVFLVGLKCKYKSGEVNLSDEHDKFEWVSKENYKKLDDGSLYYKALEDYFLGA